MSKCGECINIDWKSKSSYIDNSYWCSELKKYVKPTDYSCRYFVQDKSQKVESSGCYITTIVCDILGYEDNCELLQLLRKFRDTTLKTNAEYLPLLFEYDTIGPVISECIKNEKNNDVIALGLLKHFLLPCAKLIKEEKIEEAIDVYKNMVTYLHDEFNLSYMDIVIPKEFDYETLGKGRIRNLKTSEI